MRAFAANICYAASFIANGKYLCRTSYTKVAFPVIYLLCFIFTASKIKNYGHKKAIPNIAAENSHII